MIKLFNLKIINNIQMHSSTISFEYFVPKDKICLNFFSNKRLSFNHVLVRLICVILRFLFKSNV